MNKTQQKKDVLYVIGNIYINLFGGGRADVLLCRYRMVGSSIVCDDKRETTCNSVIAGICAKVLDGV